MFNENELSDEFEQIIEKRVNIRAKHASLEGKLKTMKDKYNDLMKTNTKKIFIYCLDSFFFQYKILSIELEHYKKMNGMVYNRMYGDYYKLFNIVITHCKECNIEIKDIKIMENLPVYQDSETNVEYKLDDLTRLHKNILAILQQLLNLYKTRKTDIQSQDDDTNVGFSITSYIETLSYENRVLYEKIFLYINYLRFYHSSQNGYLDKTTEKLDTFISDIDDEILINHKSSKNVINKQMTKEVDKNTSKINLLISTDNPYMSEPNKIIQDNNTDTLPPQDNDIIEDAHEGEED